MDTRTSPAGQGHSHPERAKLPVLRASIWEGRCRRQSPGDSVRSRKAALSDCEENPVPPGAGAGHRSRLPPPPPRGSPRPPSPLPAPSRRALLGPSLCPAPVGLPQRVPSRCGARRGAEAEPLLPPGLPESVSPVSPLRLRLCKVSPRHVPPSPERGEPAGAAVRPAALPAPCPLPSAVGGTGAEPRIPSPP